MHLDPSKTHTTMNHTAKYYQKAAHAARSTKLSHYGSVPSIHAAIVKVIAIYTYTYTNIYIYTHCSLFTLAPIFFKNIF